MFCGARVVSTRSVPPDRAGGEVQRPCQYARCGLGQTALRSAPVPGRRDVILQPASNHPQSPQRTAAPSHLSQQATWPPHSQASAAGDGRAPGPRVVPTRNAPPNTAPPEVQRPCQSPFRSAPVPGRRDVISQPASNHPQFPQRTAAPITPLATSNVATTFASLCGGGRPRSWTASCPNSQRSAKHHPTGSSAPVSVPIPVRARPRAQRRDFAACLQPSPIHATNGRPHPTSRNKQRGHHIRKPLRRGTAALRCTPALVSRPTLSKYMWVTHPQPPFSIAGQAAV